MFQKRQVVAPGESFDPLSIDGPFPLPLGQKRETVLARFDVKLIEDDGEGMEEQFIQQRLFKPFDSTKGLTGMGIGAFESRDFIRGLGGEISVESTPGHGSVFTVRIPRAKLDDSQREALDKVDQT